MATIKIESKNISKALVGSKEVYRIYYGSTLVYTKYYTITFAESGDTYGLGSWNKSTIQCPYGGSISRSGSTITVKDKDGNTISTATYSIGTGGGQYTSTVTYTNSSVASVTSNVTVTANVTSALSGFTVSLTTTYVNSTYGNAVSWDSTSISVTSGAVLDMSSNKKTVYFYKSDAITTIGTRVLTTDPKVWCSETITLQYQLQGSSEWSTLTAGTTVNSDMTIKATVTYGPFNWTPYDTHAYNGVYDDIEIVLDDAYSHGRAAYLHCTDDETSPTRWYFDTIGRDLTFNDDLPQCIDGWINIDEVDDDFYYIYDLIASSENYAYLYIPSGSDDSVWYFYYRNV